jgi:hypothetical protein
MPVAIDIFIDGFLIGVSTTASKVACKHQPLTSR